MSRLVRWLLFIPLIVIVYFLYTSGYINFHRQITWTPEEKKILKSLSIESLPSIPVDKSNRVSDNILAATLGHLVFFDTRFSGQANVSCATCHKPDQFFTDGLKVAVGSKIGLRNTMTLLGIAYSPWFFWDGRKDSLWAQALSPLENELEHAGTRMQYVHLISQDVQYRELYEIVFGELPDFSDTARFPKSAGPVSDRKWNDAWQNMSDKDRNSVTEVFVNIGKSLAAYERLLQPGPSRFDLYLKHVLDETPVDANFSKDEIAGLHLFISKAQCINCHNGPLLTNNEFHNTGVLSNPGQLPSMGRASAVREVLQDEFNCLGNFSDANEIRCSELKFVKTGDELIGSQRVPSLRNVAHTAPYMHGGQLKTLKEVIEHYNKAPNAMIGHNEAKPLGLNKKEKKQIIAFLNTLTGELMIEAKWLANPHQQNGSLASK